MTEHMKTLKKLCEAGKLATEGEWSEECPYIFAAQKLIADTPTNEGECYHNTVFIAQAANTRKSIQWAHDRIEELENHNKANKLARLESLTLRKENASLKNRIGTLEAALREIRDNDDLYQPEVQDLARKVL